MTITILALLDSPKRWLWNVPHYTLWEGGLSHAQICSSRSYWSILFICPCILKAQMNYNLFPTLDFNNHIARWMKICSYYYDTQYCTVTHAAGCTLMTKHLGGLVGTLAPSELLEFLKWMSLFTPLSKTTYTRKEKVSRCVKRNFYQKFKKVICWRVLNLESKNEWKLIAQNRFEFIKCLNWLISFNLDSNILKLIDKSLVVYFRSKSETISRKRNRPNRPSFKTRF